ncbi:MAG: DEAD/DEAH box helicase [Armatimonadetes bacterium]|nr:DEAD/DEAH box helicase [Armatimonadota bacterium]
MTNWSASSSDPAAGSRVSQAFGRLHPLVQRWVYGRGWSDLRDIQEQAVQPVLAEEDVIIAAPTAGGKTEAAYLPICSAIVDEETAGVHVLHISPLKALINDQYQRLEDLCATVGLTVHKWHGDVGQTHKQELVRDPQGILLITPESLEALFVRRGPQLPRLFGCLRYAVIDELHVFIDSERGKQLQSLLHRLELLLRRRVPRIGLSATLGDMSLAADCLRPVGSARPRVIEGASDGKELRLLVRGYCDSQPSHGDGGAEVAPTSCGAIAQHLFEKLRGTNNLIFANSRSRVELYADMLRHLSEEARVPNEFGAHHGNLSKEIREETEERLKSGDLPVSVVCTNTLELGIDIGSVESIAQIGSPPSVASLRQRLGRSGRAENKPAVLRMFVQEYEVDVRTPPQDAIRAQLVQCIAIVNLLLRGWCEPPSGEALHLSTLVQQVLSVLAQLSAAHAKPLWEALCHSGPFGSVDQSTFGQLLRSMGSHDLISQEASGMLMLGGEGERLVNHYSFYSAFMTPAEYRLIHGTRTLGTLPVDFPVSEGMYLIFAGQRWLVMRVDEAAKVIEVTPAAAGQVPLFLGSGGVIHDQVRQEMLAVYRDEALPAFLDGAARDLLAEGRRNFGQFGLGNASVVQCGQDSLLFCWRGDRVMNTLSLLLAAEGLKAARDGVAIAIERVAPQELLLCLQRLASAGPPDAIKLAQIAKNKAQEKYHWYLDEGLLSLDYASSHLDTEGAIGALRALAV